MMSLFSWTFMLRMSFLFPVLFGIICFFLLFFFFPLKESEWVVAQSCLTLCDPMGWGLPGSWVHGFFQSRVLELVAISFSRGSSQRDQTQASHIVGRRFAIWATREQANPLISRFGSAELSTLNRTFVVQWGELFKISSEMICNFIHLHTC